MTTALVCIGLLGLLPFVLGFAVSMARGREQTLIGTPTDPTSTLHKTVRAHGNTAEFAPMLAILIYVAALGDPASWVVWMMWLGTAGRYLIVFGLILSSTLDKPHPLRFVGALATYVAGTALAVAVLLSAF